LEVPYSEPRVWKVVMTTSYFFSTLATDNEHLVFYRNILEAPTFGPRRSMVSSDFDVVFRGLGPDLSGPLFHDCQGCHNAEASVWPSNN
jgi:hypothetical protein